MRNLAFLTILAATCAIVGVVSCKRPYQPRDQAQARNLTPGLSEELTALAVRHHRVSFLLVDRSDKDEEAKNLAGLITEAFEAGGWEVITYLDVPASLMYGLQCTYNPELHQKLADDLVSVFEEKGLAFRCVARNHPTPLPFMTLEVGLKP